LLDEAFYGPEVQRQHFCGAVTGNEGREAEAGKWNRLKRGWSRLFGASDNLEKFLIRSVLLSEGKERTMRVRLLALGLCCFLPAFGLEAQEKEAPTPDEALRRLKEGNARFVSGKVRPVEVSPEKYRELLKGQRPVAAVLACADSRVPPEHLFNKGFGDLFVCRVAGNVAEPYVLGSVEYAVETLNVPLLVVLGHENCGAVQAAVKKAKPGGNLEKLLEEVKVGDGLPADREAALAAATRNNALRQAETALMRSEVVRRKVEQNKLKIVSAIFHLSDGKVEWLPEVRKPRQPPR